MADQIATIIDLLQKRADPGRARSLVADYLQAIATGQRECIGAEHVLGFVHARLGEDLGRVLRLHVWPVPKLAPAEPVWPVHTHRFRLTSLILSGVVTNHIYELQPVEKGPHRLYEVRYGRSGSRREATTQLVSCLASESRSYRAGEFYLIEYGEFHASTVEPNTFAATIVVTDPPGDQPPLVVGESNGMPAYEYQPASIDASQFAQLVQHVLRRMHDDD